MNKPLENRSYAFEVRADEENSGVITGTPILYNSETNIGNMFIEIIERGALNNTDLKDVRFLVNHDLSKIPLARSRNNNANSTMQLSVDENGMNIRVQLDIENNSDARNLYSAVKRGDVSGMSFMFVVSDEKWENIDSDLPTRRITEISTVIEVSAVTFPAYADTKINARSTELENSKSVLENARLSVRSLDNDKEVQLLKLKFKALHN